MKRLSLSIALLLPLLAQATEPAFHAWAQTPPMGWNSWDGFATTVTEAQTRAQADYMAKNLKSHGWSYIVVDIQWYEPNATGFDYRKDATLVLDQWGRLQPAANRFPSAANGAGFKPLADYVHSLGLKFGIHLMRGIPQQAVDRNLPVKGTSLHAQDVANRNSICPWNPDMYGVDMTKPGAQEYYDSVFALIASWGVDYVKVDDISRPYHEHASEIEAVRRAIDRSGRPIVLSLSPGETALDAAAHVRAHANLWRISDDFWDSWPSLHEQFARLAKWNPYRMPGAWPDADMLPFGVLELGKRTTKFTKPEQITLMTLWSIARSPLMHGGDMTKMDDFTLSLLTNDAVLAVNQHSTNNRPLFDHDDHIAWIADVPDSKDKYLAVFNARDRFPLIAERAEFRSGRLAAAKREDVRTVEIDLVGATKLFLVADDLGDGNDKDYALWIEPRLVMKDGSERRLTELPWVRAEASWAQVSKEKTPGGKPMMHGGGAIAYGICARAKSTIEYDLPVGAVAFKASVALDDTAISATNSGTVEFLVFAGRPGGENLKETLPVTVTLAELGFSGAVQIEDLWTQANLGVFRDTFAPEIPWHGAGLYRISAADHTDRPR